MRLKEVSKFFFATALTISCSFAVTPTIGVASAFGTFTVNNAKMEGNANVFDGSQIKTGAALSRIYLQSGAELMLATNSAGTFYKDHVILQQGAARLDNMSGYSIQAGTYRIESSQPYSEAVVRLNGGMVEVAALSGNVNVFNGQGALLTRIGAGTSSSFQNNGNTAGQSGATAATPENNSAKKKALLYGTLGTTLAGLGLSTDAILQPASP